MPLLRSLLYAAIFYPATLLWGVAGIVGSLSGRRFSLAVVVGCCALAAVGALGFLVGQVVAYLTR